MYSLSLEGYVAVPQAHLQVAQYHVKNPATMSAETNLTPSLQYPCTVTFSSSIMCELHSTRGAPRNPSAVQQTASNAWQTCVTTYLHLHPSLEKIGIFSDVNAERATNRNTGRYLILPQDLPQYPPVKANEYTQNAAACTIVVQA